MYGPVCFLSEQYERTSGVAAYSRATYARLFLRAYSRAPILARLILARLFTHDLHAPYSHAHSHAPVYETPDISPKRETIGVGKPQGS